jgi:hypothetical protein
MRYLAIWRTTEATEPPTPEHMAAMGALVEEMTAAGVLLDTGGCKPSVTGFRVRRSGGRLTVTDGPFTETKELVCGFAIFQVGSREEALEWTRRFLAVAGDGESEVREMYGPEDFGAPPEALEAAAHA